MRQCTAIIFTALAAVATPAAAQISLSLGTGSDTTGQSTATVTTQTIAPPAVNFDGAFANAVVLSAVNVRTGPSSHGTQVTGTLHQGDTVSVRCNLGWCELADNGGYAAQKFLSFSDTGSFTVAPVPTGQSTGGQDAMTTVATTDPGAVPAPAGANFDGLWTVVDDSGQRGNPLILTQAGDKVTGTLQSKERVAKITGDIEGNKLSFTYNMVDAKGKAVASGNGFLNLASGGQSLSGVLMLNGLVISNVNATR